MFLLTFADFIGRFHPVFVHLPIGILLLACVFLWVSLEGRYASLRPAVPAMLFWGMISAVASCITGFFLASTDYEGGLVSRHQWMGISVAVVSAGLYLIQKRAVGKSVLKGLSLGLIILVTITGHLGGSITHGEGYLTAGLSSAEYEEGPLKPIPDIQNAQLYTGVVQPILESRCYSCHGEGKQKGKLRLDTREHMFKGGKNGEVIQTGKPEESQLVERMLLPLGDDDHMPPKGKPQPGKSEIEVLQWWIATGADFDKKVSELEQTEEVKAALAALESGAVEETGPSEVPDVPVEPADTAAVNALKRIGVIVIPAHQNSNYLIVNFVAAEKRDDEAVALLQPLKKQLVSLKLDNTSITDAALGTIAECQSLTRLHISNTDVTDEGVSRLETLEQLQALNLVGTKVTAKGVMALHPLKSLRYLYLYRTGVSTSEWESLRQAFPGTVLDSGNYSLPMLATDTTVVSLP